MKKLINLLILATVFFIFASCNQTHALDIKDINKIAESYVLEDKNFMNDEIPQETMTLFDVEILESGSFTKFYVHTLFNKDDNLYAVEYASYDVISSLWLCTIIIDGDTGEIIDVLTHTQFYSGLSPEMGLTSRLVRGEIIIEEFGTFESI